MSLEDIVFFLVSGYCIFGTVNSVRNIMIGTGKLKHPMYDNDVKKKAAFKKGIIGLIVFTIGSVVFIFFSIAIILSELGLLL